MSDIKVGDLPATFDGAMFIANRTPTRRLSDPKPTDLVGLDAWLPEPSAPPLVGLDRTVSPDFWKRRYAPDSWLTRLRVRLAEWVAP